MVVNVRIELDDSARRVISRVGYGKRSPATRAMVADFVRRCTETRFESYRGSDKATFTVRSNASGGAPAPAGVDGDLP